MMEPHSRPGSSHNGTLRLPQALVLLLRTTLAGPTSDPVTQTADPGEKILAMNDSRELLDDYALLAAATAAAQAYGPLKSGVAIHPMRHDIRPGAHRVPPQWRSGSTVAWAA